MLEAMAHEVPLVVTDAEGPREIVTDGQTGLVIRREDPVALGQALERLIRDRDLAGTLARRARQQVETTYTLPAVVPRLQQALEAVVLLRHRSGREPASYRARPFRGEAGSKRSRFPADNRSRTG